MGEQIADTDCFYECLPGPSGTSSSLNERNCTLPSSMEVNIASSSTSENDTKDVSESAETVVKKCICRQHIQWAWDNDTKSENVELANDNLDVKFHRSFSNGTAVVRSTEPMSDDQYYFEVKMISPVYGTDMMVGVGTADSRMQHVQDKFVSLLGKDNKSWGYSYTGLFHHSGYRNVYAESFTRGSTVGVHVDLWRGTITFYKDRKHLGVASTNLKGKTLYAMACSTAARSKMRVVHSSSFPSSLQFMCCKKLRECIPPDQKVLDVLDMPPGLKQFLENKLSWLMDKRYILSENEELYDCCPVKDDDKNEEETNDQSSQQVYDPFGITSQFILLGAVLVRDHNRQERLRARDSDEREDSNENGAKRRRFSVNYTAKFPDCDKE